jgi:hypothetical protein
MPNEALDKAARREFADRLTEALTIAQEAWSLEHLGLEVPGSASGKGPG